MPVYWLFDRIIKASLVQLVSVVKFSFTQSENVIVSSKRVQETMLASRTGRKCGKIWLSVSVNAKCALSLIPTVVGGTAKKIWTVSS